MPLLREVEYLACGFVWFIGGGAENCFLDMPLLREVAYLFLQEVEYLSDTVADERIIVGI